MCVPTSRIPSASITTVQVPGFSTKGSTKLFWGTLTKVGSALGAKTICLDCSEPRKHPRRTEWDTETEGYNCWCMRNKYSQLNNRTFISWTLCFVSHAQSNTFTLWLVETYLCGSPDRLLFYHWTCRPQSLHIWGWSESDRRLPRSHKPEASLPSTRGVEARGGKEGRMTDMKGSRMSRGWGNGVGGRRKRSLVVNP